MNLTPLTPITELYVCHSIPLDNTYRDTFSKKFFPSATAQASFFINNAKFTFTNLSPVRLQNQIRLPINADKLYDCNYIYRTKSTPDKNSFTNTDYQCCWNINHVVARFKYRRNKWQFISNRSSNIRNIFYLYSSYCQCHYHCVY